MGDGLYVSDDGYQTKLRAPRLGGDHEVFLDATVLKNLFLWVAAKLPEGRRPKSNDRSRN